MAVNRLIVAFRRVCSNWRMAGGGQSPRRRGGQSSGEKPSNSPTPTGSPWGKVSTTTRGGAKRPRRFVLSAATSGNGTSTRPGYRAEGTGNRGRLPG